jgi:hypothetical protein
MDDHQCGYVTKLEKKTPGSHFLIDSIIEFLVCKKKKTIQFED